MQDLECVGIISSCDFHMDQHVHMVDGVIALSPDVGQIQVTQNHVWFLLEVSCGKRQWQFEIELVCACQPKLPVERYAWVRIGSPIIDNIGRDFVSQMGHEICGNKYVSFLEQRLDKFLNLSVDNEEVKEENPLT